MEIEAKFRVPDEQTFRRLLELTALAGYSLWPVAEAQLHDRYLDTANRALLAAGFACRLRQQGGRTLATLKGLGEATGAVHRRAEYEVSLDEPLPPAAWPDGEARDLALRVCGAEPLCPLFDLEQIRHSRRVSDADRTAAELSLDHVTLRRGDAILASYLELEAELVGDGREEDLTRIAAHLEEEWGLVPQGRSKFERALELTGLAEPEGEEEPAIHPRLTDEERAIVERLGGEREVIARRARLLLAWDEGCSRGEMVQRSGLSARRARHWRWLFHQRRLGIFPARALRAASAGLRGAGSAVPAAGPGLPAAERSSSERAALPAVVAVAEPSPAALTREDLPKRPGMEPDDPMSEAGRKTFYFHFQRMLYHEPGTRDGQDIEDLHDMRVATRRMRAAFRVFGDYYEPKKVRPFLKGLQQTGQALGPVRDLDVFYEKVLAYQATLPPSQQGSLDGFLQVLRAQHEAARERMIRWLDSGKYRRFVEQFARFVETPGMGSRSVELGSGEPRPYRVRHVAPMAIYERLAAVRAYDEWVTVPQPPVIRLHALRIAGKRLRYTLEFFAEVLGPAARIPIKEVVALQDHLGNLQDAVVASAILRDYLIWGTWGPGTADRPMPGPEAPVIAPGVASYLAVRQTDLQKLLASFPPVWQRFTGEEFGRGVAEAVAGL